MWNPDQKVWYKNVSEDSIEAEKRILAATIYDNVFKGRVKKIDPIIDKKLRSEFNIHLA